MKICSYCGAEYTDDAEFCSVDQQPLKAGVVLAEETRKEEKHSSLGMASFGISIAVGCLTLAMFVIASLLNAGRIQQGQSYPGQTVVGFVILFLMAADIAAAGLGIAAICQTGRKRLFGLLGLVFSSITILGTFGLVIIGLVYASRFTR
jgi:hypothetical protein